MRDLTPSFNSSDVAAANRLLKRAYKKEFFWEFILNINNNAGYKCDIRILLRYSAGEGDDTLYEDILRILDLARRGVSFCQLVGKEPLKEMAEFALKYNNGEFSSY